MKWITLAMVSLVWSCASAPAAPTEPPTLPATLVAPTAGVTSTVAPTQPVPRPPPASLSIEGQQQPAGVGTYCWFDPTPVPAGAPGLCLDAVGIPTVPEPLVVPAGPLTATFELNGPGEPAEVVLRVLPATGEPQAASGWLWWPPNPEGAQSISLAPAAQPTIELSLRPGQHVLDLFVRWEGAGDVSYGFLVEAE